MALSPPDQKNVDNFFLSISPFADAYQHGFFTYIALKRSNSVVLLQGRLFLNTAPSTSTLKHFETPTILAGRYRLLELNTDAQGLVRQLADGKLTTPHGDLTFPSSGSARYAATHIPLHPDGLQSQQRINVLRFLGGQIQGLIQPDLDWEIKAAETPFDGLQELSTEYAVGFSSNTTIVNVEIVAFNVAAIDAARSVISGTHAIVHILLAKGLLQDKLTLGYRSYKPGAPVIRGSIKGTSINWSDENTHYRGIASLQVLDGSVVNCVPSYAGVAQSHLWIADPTKLQNSRRAAYEAFDDNLETVRDIVAKALRKGDEARDLEAAISWILWMIGFSAVQLGGTRRTQDAADLVACTPSGHFAVIECTTGLLRADNKLTILHDRTLAVRRSLETSNHGHLRVLPVLVTSKTREDIRVDIEQAERLGMLVMTREDISRALDRTLQLPTADQMYDEGWQAVRAAQAKHDAQQALPLSLGAPIS